MSAKTASLFWYCWNNIRINDTFIISLFCLQSSISERFKLVLLQQKMKKGRMEGRKGGRKRKEQRKERGREEDRQWEIAENP